LRTTTRDGLKLLLIAAGCVLLCLREPGEPDAGARIEKPHTDFRARRLGASRLGLMRRALVEACCSQ